MDTNADFDVDGRREYEDMENCKVYNLTDSSERNECTPGSEYILK